MSIDLDFYYSLYELDHKKLQLLCIIYSINPYIDVMQINIITNYFYYTGTFFIPISNNLIVYFSQFIIIQFKSDRITTLTA